MYLLKHITLVIFIILFFHLKYLARLLNMYWVVHKTKTKRTDVIL